MLLIVEISGGVWQLETVQHCLSAVMSVWFFMDFVLVTLNVMMMNDVMNSIDSDMAWINLKKCHLDQPKAIALPLYILLELCKRN